MLWWTLRRLLESRNSFIRRWAAMKLGESRDARAVELLVAALQDGDEYVQEAVVKALVKIGEKSALIRIGSTAVEPLVAVLKDQESYARRVAADLLGQIGDARAVEPLVVALKDQDDDVRMSAALALGQIGDARAVGPLIGALHDHVSRVQSAAVMALVRIGPAAVELLVRYSSLSTADPSSRVRRAAAEVLGQIGDARAVEALIRAGPATALDAASDLHSLGDAYYDLSQYDKASASYEQALRIWREVGDRAGQGTTLKNLGAVYDALGQYAKAIAFYEQALGIAREVGSRDGEGTTLNNLGYAYMHLSQYAKAIESYEQALEIWREIGDRVREGTTLNHLGTVYEALSQYAKAIASYEQALEIWREIGDRVWEGTTLDKLGDIFAALSQYSLASYEYEQELGIWREEGSRELEGMVLSTLMAAWQAQRAPRLAIFYGKQAVNVLRAVRGDPLWSGSSLIAVEDAYRVLAELLIAEGRLLEAEQVLRLLKEEELFEFVQRDQQVVNPLVRLALTKTEAQWAARYLEIANRLSALGREKRELEGKTTRTAAEETQLQTLNAELRTVRQAFLTFLVELAQGLRRPKRRGVERRVETVEESASTVQGTVRALDRNTVALYTLVGKDKCWLIVVTAELSRVYEVSITATDLSRKVQAFRQIVQQPDLDPRPLGKELYDLLITPVEDDLRQAAAQTVMWSLDGVLRYLPLAALYDGQQYLVERYRLEIFTLGGRDFLRDLPSPHWRAAGLGVSKPLAGFRALPGVPEEVHGIVHTESTGGILPGIVALDERFTAQVFEEALKYPVVHIASHFQFRPGTEADSFLLLGNGQKLSVAELKTYDFQAVELLTLSACNTAFNGGGESRVGDGKEIESFAMLAQRGGAKAVVASLWPVADASTKELMQAFYGVREATEGTSKAEALRQAQLALLYGEQREEGAEGTRGAAKVTYDRQSLLSPTVPSFVTDPHAPYAHPYYWAPFILIGNWK